MKKERWWLYLLMPILALLGSVTFANTVQAKELTNVITKADIWATSINGPKPTEADGSYSFWLNTEYKYAIDFDLSKYDGNLDIKSNNF